MEIKGGLTWIIVPEDMINCSREVKVVEAGDSWSLCIYSEETVSNQWSCSVPLKKKKNSKCKQNHWILLPTLSVCLFSGKNCSY